jgi:thiol-disulfide isomerase/thioredoxin
MRPTPPRFQSGQAGRRALLVLAGLSAAAAGAWWASRRAPQAASANNASPANASAHAPAQAQAPSAADAASAPLIQSDQLTAAFWAQQFDTPKGTRLNLDRFKGKPLLINFWATWCPPCVKELPELDRFHKDFTPKGWQVIGLAIDGPTPVKEFLAKVGVGFDLGLAGFGGTELSQALGNEAGGLPFSVVIDAQGRVRHRKMGATSYEELAKWAKEISGA